MPMAPSRVWGGIRSWGDRFFSICDPAPLVGKLWNSVEAYVTLLSQKRVGNLWVESLFLK